MAGLVVYFSHEGQNSVNFDIQNVKKGHTRTVAEKIADITGSDIFRIVPAEPYPADYDAVCRRAQAEYEDNIHPQINVPFESLESYDTIYIGFPIWFRSYPRVVASFIDKFDFTGKTVKPFCTNEEGEFGIADMELENAVKVKGGKVVKGLAVRGSDVNTCDEALRKWLQ